MGNCKRADFSRHKCFPSELTEDQLSCINGLLLGDGCIPLGKGRYHSFYFEQCEARKEYAQHVFDVLRPYTKDKKLTTVLNDKTKHNKGKYLSVRFRTVTHPVFSDVRKNWYEANAKIVNRNIVLNWTTMAYWFADDGHSRKKGKEIVLCSESFCEDDNEFLVSEIKSRLGVKSSLCKRSGGSGFGIRILSCDYFDFIENVSSVIGGVHCLGYKLDISGATNNSTPRYEQKDKELVLQLHSQGKNMGELASMLGCHVATIKRWVNG